MRQYSRKTESANHDIEVFIHDMASPLSSIDINLSLLRNQLKRDSFNDPSIEDSLTRAVSSLEQLNFIIERRRDLSKPKEEVKVLDEISALKMIYESQLREQNIDFEIRCSRKVLFLADRYRFVQVVDNLIRNSIDALQKSSRTRKKILVKVSTDKQNIYLSVRDNGYGIPPDLRHKIFDLNYTTKNGHSGIGLWLVNQVVSREFKGEISLSSKLSKFTVVKLTLPFKLDFGF